MKLDILENFNAVRLHPGQKRNIIGVASIANKRNKNGRLYPLHLLQKEADRLQAKIDSKTESILLSLDHPNDSSINLQNAAASLTRIWMQDNIMYFQAKVLKTTNGNNLISMIEDGVIIGVSTRGLGSVDKNNVVDSYEMLTLDFVSNPSEVETSIELTESLKRQLDNDVEYQQLKESKDIYSKMLLESTFENLDVLVSEAIDKSVDGLLMNLGSQKLMESMKGKGTEDKFFAYCMKLLENDLPQKPKSNLTRRKQQLSQLLRHKTGLHKQARNINDLRNSIRQNIDAKKNLLRTQVSTNITKGKVKAKSDITNKLEFLSKKRKPK